MLSRLCHYWVYGGFLAGLALVLLIPMLQEFWPVWLLGIFLQLPAYMLHQFEEHDADRFRSYFNRTLGAGREVLTPAAVFVINVPGVWGVILLSLYLARYANPGWGCLALYLTLINAITHVGAAIRGRAYNPGLATALLLFLPVSGYGFYQLQQAHPIDLKYHILGLLSAIAIHAAILIYVRGRIMKLKQSAA